MIRLRFSFTIICCGLLLHAWPAYGCRYNVREVGFIDIGIEPYHLFEYVPKDAPTQVAADLQNAVEAALLDTNIRFEMVFADADANHPALRYLAEHEIAETPATVLVSPDGQSRPVLTGVPIGSLETALPAALDAILSSPTRKMLLQKAAESYGVVLLVEGPDSQSNAEARTAITTAMGRIEEQLEFLPKPIAHGPELVVVDHPSLPREEVLLWSLGLKPEDVNEPHAAIFYGRGRWIGPMFKGELIHEDHLTELLFIIGADCECGLDHRWLQGTMLPGRWDEELQAKVAESLGFDPENPMIKMEMISIVRRGMGGFAYPGVPFGYREVEVGEAVADPCVEEVNIASEQDERSVPEPRSQPAAVREPVIPSEGGSGIGLLAASLGGMLVLVAIASCVIVLRAKKA